MRIVTSRKKVVTATNDVKVAYFANQSIESCIFCEYKSLFNLIKKKQSNFKLQIKWFKIFIQSRLHFFTISVQIIFSSLVHHEYVQDEFSRPRHPIQQP